MRNYKIDLNYKECKEITDVFKMDLTDLVLDEEELLARCTIITGEHDNGFTFSLDDKSALVIMQTFFVYADRLRQAADNRSFAFYSFGQQMFTPFTSKTEDDF